jgi:hypothetical protein
MGARSSNVAVVDDDEDDADADADLDSLSDEDDDDDDADDGKTEADGTRTKYLPSTPIRANSISSAKSAS